jgi:AmmeMemoRadiSam system protein B
VSARRWIAAACTAGMTLTAVSCSVARPAPAPAESAEPRRPAAVEASVRQPFDRVGYTHTADGIARVIEHAREAEAPALAENARRLGLDERTAFVAAIAPHDDHLYAERVCIHSLPFVRARHVVLIGVAHRARQFPQSEGKLVFDSFDAWHGPYGPVGVSPLRAALLSRLPPDDVLVSSKMHAGEHSLEGLVPFLQHHRRDVEIVPILVPYMRWERLAELAARTASALAGILRERRLSLGEDVALLISSDSVHYGDEGWGGRRFADFGTDGAAYDRAVARDVGLVDDYLTGPIRPHRVEAFYRSVVADDCHEYRITWCGRFSIPFGLAALSGLCAALGRPGPRGDLLRYGTTLDPGRSDLRVEGLGVTAPANLHHWVGFVSVGYR